MSEEEYERESVPIRLKYRELVKFLNENRVILDTANEVLFFESDYEFAVARSNGKWVVIT